MLKASLLLVVLSPLLISCGKMGSKDENEMLDDMSRLARAPP